MHGGCRDIFYFSVEGAEACVCNYDVQVLDSVGALEAGDGILGVGWRGTVEGEQAEAGVGAYGECGEGDRSEMRWGVDAGYCCVIWAGEIGC